MSSAGVEFGSHTVTHPILSMLDADTMRRELTESKAAVESHTGRPCRVFAYPNGGPGDFGSREQEALADIGYSCAFTQMGAHSHLRTPRFALPRANVRRSYDALMFASATAGLLDLAHRARVAARPGLSRSPDPAAEELDYAQ